jgi:hypothetical protein
MAKKVARKKGTAKKTVKKTPKKAVRKRAKQPTKKPTKRPTKRPTKKVAGKAPKQEASKAAQAERTSVVWQDGSGNSRRKHKRNKGEPTPAQGKPKISEKIREFAGAFIGTGDTLAKRRGLLNAAVSAWNIASNLPELRKKRLDQYVEEYKKFNPTASKKEIDEVRSDMKMLIEMKLEMFAHDMRQIVSARIIDVEGRDRIEAVAATIN